MTVDGAEGAARAKDALRARVRAGRRLRSEADLRRGGRLIAGRARSVLTPLPSTVASYVALPDEPRTGDLNSDLARAGFTVLLPRVAGTELEWVVLRPDMRWRTGPFGIREPVGPADGDLTDAAVVFLPATAVDPAGSRLGQGGGFYDRCLAALPRHDHGGPLLVAVVHDDEVVPHVPAGPHDVAVDAVLTPERLLSIRTIPADG